MWCEMVWYGLAREGTVCYGYGVVWGTEWYGMVLVWYWMV